MVERSGSDIQETLSERKTQHGPFDRHAVIECELRHILTKHGGRLPPAHEAALGMIFHKAARILNGGHRHSDTWHDIAGYATIVEDLILNE